MRTTDIVVGQRFTKLVVLGLFHRSRNRWARVRCDCGTEKEVRCSSLLAPEPIRACGCLLRGPKKHGFARDGVKPTPEYTAWARARGRCTNPTNPDFPNYGGRGITFSPRWSDFKQFLEDMGPRPSAAHSIDRIDNAKGYEPGNVRWATRTQQNRNKRSVRTLAWKGRVLTRPEWSEVTGIPTKLIGHRLRLGWSIDRALGTPVQTYRQCGQAGARGRWGS